MWLVLLRSIRRKIRRFRVSMSKLSAASLELIFSRPSVNFFNSSSSRPLLLLASSELNKFRTAVSFSGLARASLTWFPEKGENRLSMSGRFKSPSRKRKRVCERARDKKSHVMQNQNVHRVESIAPGHGRKSPFSCGC